MNGTLFRLCGKLWIGRRISFRIEPCAVDTDEPLQRKNLLAGFISRYRRNGICRSVGTLLRLRTCSRSGSNPETKQRGWFRIGPKIRGQGDRSQSKCPRHEPLQTRRTKSLNVATEARSARIQNTCAFRVKRRSDQCVQCRE
jgi:hypothetical protein